MQIEHIFDADLQFRPDMEALASADGRDGELIGSGDGEVRGKLNGKLSWTIFEEAHGDFCDMNPAGLIETDDGAKIPFDGRGYAIREADSQWKTGIVLKFSPSDERYAWLADAPALVAGTFDEETGQGVWRVYGRTVAAGVAGA